MLRSFKFPLIAGCIALLGLLSGALAAGCTIPIGGVFPLSGGLASFGKTDAQAAQLAVNDLNAAGGVNGCQLELVLTDSQTSAQVGVDATKKLVAISHVPAVVGALASGTTAPMLTAVTAPSHVVLISPASTSPLFTQLAKEGKTGGYWFRTVASDALVGTGIAKVAIDNGYKRVAVIYLNDPYGQGLSNAFAKAFEALGGTVTGQVVFDPNQPSYKAEVAKALENSPGALFLVAHEDNGALIARQWISAGGPQRFFFPYLNSQGFIDSIGAQYTHDVWGIAPGSTKTPSLTTFQQEYQATFKEAPGEFSANSYDAVVLIGLAMAAAGDNTAQAVRDNIRTVSGAGGTAVYAGVQGLKKGLALLESGQKISYVGATGPMTFDANGDVSGALLVWRVQDGKIENVRTMSVEEVNGLLKQVSP